MSNITLNIVAPDTPTPTPVDPGIDPSVPSTGLFTHGIGTTEATIIAIVSAVLLLTIVAVVVAILYKKHKAQNKTTKLVHLVDNTKAIITNKKRVTATLTAIALLVSAGTFIALAKNAVNATESDEQANQAEGDDSSLTVDVSSEELTIEVGNEPVFAVLPVEVSVEEATLAGYTLTAYADSTDLVSTTDPDNTIPMIAVDEADLSENELATLVPLTDNTYGLALGEEPTSKDAEVYTALSTDSLNPTIIKSMTEYTPTEENDTTTIYYGFYITPDIPYGTYTNDGEVYYNATINTTLVTFDGKGLYFDEEQTQSTNTVEYIAVSQENNETETSSTINQPISGEYKTPSQSLPYIFLGWSTDPTATEPTYTSEDDIAEHLPISPNIPLTLYAVWQKATELSFDGNDNDGGTGISSRTIAAGSSTIVPENTFTKEGFHFTSWNTDKYGEGQEYLEGAEYTAQADFAGYVTLFAQWEKDGPTIDDLTEMQDFATLTEEDKASVLNSMTQEQQYQLEDSRDHKVYYISRLKDDNIWMTQNLDFNIVNGGAGLDSTNTDVPTNWADAGNLANTYTTGTTTWNYPTTTPESYDPGNRYWNGELNENWDGTLDNMTTESGDSHYHIGNYYNWTAAIAMSDSSSYTSSGTDANQSICPAGWRLPNNSENKSYQNLVNTQGLSAGTSGNIQNSPVYFVYGGLWSGSSSDVGSNSYYWSSVVYDSDESYKLYFSVNGALYPQTEANRDIGYSLRCVAR